MTDTDSTDALPGTVATIEEAPPDGIEVSAQVPPAPAAEPDAEAAAPAAPADETAGAGNENVAPAEETAGGEADGEEPEASAEEPDELDDGEAEAEAGEDAAGDAEGAEKPGEGEVLPLASVVEALLFAAREPLKVQNLARAAGKGTKQEAVREAVAELNLHYLETGRAFEIAEISGRLQLMSRPEYAAAIARLYPKKPSDTDKAIRLTPPALETLAVIAYKQPATRAEIERIRGCGCGPALRTLVERGSVRVAGKRTDLVGQPLLYATTEAFLAEFGLGSLDELPLRSEFMAPAALAAEPEEGAARVLQIIPPEAPEAEVEAEVESEVESGSEAEADAEAEPEAVPESESDPVPAAPAE